MGWKWDVCVCVCVRVRVRTYVRACLCACEGGAFVFLCKQYMDSVLASVLFSQCHLPHKGDGQVLTGNGHPLASHNYRR